MARRSQAPGPTTGDDPGIDEDGVGNWREQAVARSLDPARARAEKRVQRFLDAALELMESGTDREFTVQEVVERSGQSLRSFYLYFAGKHELLLALFEESIRGTADHLRDAVVDVDDPLERLRRCTTEYYRMCRPDASAPPRKRGSGVRPTPAMGEFAQQLLSTHPREASQAFVPLLSLFEELLDDAAADGSIRPGLAHARIAGVVLQVVMFNAFSTTISGVAGRTAPGDAAEELWSLLMHGIAE